MGEVLVEFLVRSTYTIPKMSIRDIKFWVSKYNYKSRQEYTF